MVCKECVMAGDLFLYQLVAPGDQPIVAYKGVCPF